MTTAPVDFTGIEPYLTVLALHNATDLHLTAGAPPLLRIDGRLTPLDERSVRAAVLQVLHHGYRSLCSPPLVGRSQPSGEPGAARRRYRPRPRIW